MGTHLSPGGLRSCVLGGVSVKIFLLRILKLISENEKCVLSDFREREEIHSIIIEGKIYKKEHGIFLILIQKPLSI